MPAIYDARGRSVASVSFTANVDPALKRWPLADIHPGDVFLWNHPYQSEGGIGHLPDLCLSIPVFHDGRLIAWVQELGHVQDIGGEVPGSLSLTATEIFQEGLILPPLKLCERGVRNQAVVTILLGNTRFPDDLEGDLDAMLAGARIGVARIEWLARQYGADLLEQAFEALLQRCARTLLDDVLLITSPGGGGWGDPLERDPALVEQGVERGLVTESAARELYGVLPGDPAGTTAARARIARERPPRPTFDRGARYADLVARGVLQPRLAEPPGAAGA